MAITLTEVITVEEYLAIYPQDTAVEEDLIQSAINRAIITLDGICGGMIEKVWGVIDPTDPLYRTETEKDYIKKAHLIQAQWNVSRSNDMSAGTESYTSGSNNYNETRPQANLVADEVIYQLLAQGRVYNPNIATETTIKSGFNDFYNPTEDIGDNYITYNVGDLRYVKANNTDGAGKYAKWDDNGNIVAEEIKVSTTGTSSAVANFITIGGLEYQLGAGAGSAIWGRIEGTLSDQTDLQQVIDRFTQEITNLYSQKQDLITSENKLDYSLLANTPTIPTKTSQLENDSGFLTQHQSLDNYATKTWVEDKHYLTEHQSLTNYYTKSETNQLLDNKQDIINKYCDRATVDNNTLTINFSNGDTTSFTPTSQPGGITDVQITDTQGTSSVVVGGVATIDLTGYATNTNVNTQLANKVDKITTSGYGAYGHSEGAEHDWTISANADQQTLAYRTTNGVLRVGTPTEDNHATTKAYVDSVIPTIYVSTTYSELKTLRDNSQLVAGCWYRITDYVATTTQTDTQATTNQYDIIVLATSTNTLSEEARAIQHSGDTYFANSNLNKWKVWYSLDNDSDRYAWADTTNGKGVVYRLIDEFDNSVWYDFKLIQVKNTNKSDRFYYLFDNSGVDASLNTSSTITCYSNHFGNYITSNKYNIGKNICYGGNYFNSNTIGNYFYSNTIGNSFNRNTIENYFNSNTIGKNFYSNTIGNSFNRNTIENYFNSNTIGNNFYSNTIGNNFYDNTIGNNFYSNTIGNNFYNNNTTTQTSQPSYCSFPSGVTGLITTSTTLTRTSKTTYYIGSDSTLKTLN